MRIFIFILSIFILQSCSKPKTVLICGDHVCVNNKEAEQYFKENLSLEVKVIDNKKTKEDNLVELNLKTTEKGEKQVKIYSKKETNKTIKTLSKLEIKNKKKMVKEKIKIDKKKIGKSDKTVQKLDNKKKISVKETTQSEDICKILKDCNITEISKYLIDEGRKKKFPDITLRE